MSKKSATKRFDSPEALDAALA
jgi:hypothetical protein